MCFPSVIFHLLRPLFIDGPEPLPPSVRQLFDDRMGLLERYPIMTRSWHVSLRRISLLSRIRGVTHADTSSAALYRMYEMLVLDWTTMFRNELEYFWGIRHEWAVRDIPDPCDKDPLRYAILAVLTKLMCLAFNRKISLGIPRDAPAIIQNWDELQSRPRILEEPPEWAYRVPAVSPTVRIADMHGKFPDDDEICDELAEMGIRMAQPHIYFM